MVKVISQKKNNFTNGFTLIELLVVISIISLLSTVVMASLNQSRTKAQEATIKQTLQSIKTQAELEYSKTGDYSNVATAIAPMLAHINKNGGVATTTFSTITNEGYKRYAVSVKLNSDSAKNWSVSSEGGVVMWDPSDTTPNDNWFAAVLKCEESVGGRSGRLPTIEEFKSFHSAGGMTLERGFTATDYWSSNTDSTNPDKAYYIIRANGSVSKVEKTWGGPDRCVR